MKHSTVERRPQGKVARRRVARRAVAAALVIAVCSAAALLIARGSVVSVTAGLGAIVAVSFIAIAAGAAIGAPSPVAARIRNGRGGEGRGNRRS